MKPPRIDSQNRRFCSAHRASGDECRAPTIKGGTVCRVHGGSAGHLKAAAKRRLLEAADPAVWMDLEIARLEANLGLVVDEQR